MNEGIYNAFWDKSIYEVNSPKLIELKKNLYNEFKLKLELWKSAKISFKTFEVIYTDELKKFKYKKTKTDYEKKIYNNFYNILLISALHKNYKLAKDSYTKSTLIFIENMISRQKSSIKAINTLFVKSWNKKPYVQYFKYGKIKTDFLMLKEYITKSYEYELILSGMQNGNNIYIKESIATNKSLKTCIIQNLDSVFAEYNPKNVLKRKNEWIVKEKIKGFNYEVKLLCKKIDNDMITLIEINKQNTKYITFENLKNQFNYK
jgi:hypothetical protein